MKEITPNPFIVWSTLACGALAMAILWGGMALLWTESAVRALSNATLLFDTSFTRDANHIIIDVHEGKIHIISVLMGMCMALVATVGQAFLLWRKM